MKQMSWQRIWALALFLLHLKIEVTTSVNILAIFTFVGKSHNVFYSAITKGLAEKGHNFTVVTSLPIDSPPHNYHQIDVSDTVAHNFSVLNSTRKVGAFDLLKELPASISNICQNMLQQEELQALVKPKHGTQYDLILMSNFYAECLYPFAQIYNAPIVLVSPAGPMPSTYSSVGNVMLPSYFADPFFSTSDRMTFKERIFNTVIHTAFNLYYKYSIQRRMEYEMRTVFGEEIQSISQLEEHVSLVILNHHFSLNEPRPTVPCLIEAGGLHVKPPKELPKDLKTFLDGAGKDGIIYFSLGTILKSHTFPRETKEAFFTAFSRVKQRVLWKWEGENPIPGQSKNVRLEKWLPQQDVLAHPNVKLFITHGGLLSFQEAASRGVPLIGIPHFGDQAMNMKRVLHHKVGVQLDAENLTASNILNSINEVLENPIYSENMKRLQSIVMDQRDHPLERAVYWIEYVIRHKGAKHLKPAAFYLSWYQICLLDILLFSLVISSLTLGIGLFCFKLMKRICRYRRNIADTKKTQ